MVANPTTSSRSSEPGHAAIHQSSARLAVGGDVLDIHYRVAGSGPPLFLLHPSPLSSAFMEPLMRRLAGRVTAIAPDTPGFGDSDPIAGNVPDLAPYVEAMIGLRSALGLDKVAVYGSATGAQIAIEWAKADARRHQRPAAGQRRQLHRRGARRHHGGLLPQRDPNCGRQPPSARLADGPRRALFFPWQQPRAANRLTSPPAPPAAMDLTARGYLTAGPGYEAAYRAAFCNERAEQVQPIQAPLVIMRWKGSILKRWTDRFDDYQWGANVVMAHCGPPLEERWVCLEAHLDAVLPQERTSSEKLRLATGVIRYADSNIGQIRYRVPAGAPSRILIHGLGGSSASIAPELADDETVLIDLPGHGGSAKPETLSMADWVQALQRVASQLGAGPYAICGVGATEGLAAQAAAGDGRLRFKPLGLPWHGEEAPDLTPEISGAHLWSGWHWLRRQWLERNEAPPEPVRLTRLLLDLLQAGPA